MTAHTSSPNGASMKREILPGRRLTETFEFLFQDKFMFTASVGRYEDGRFAELFLNAHKSTTQVDIDARDVALLISFALQFGVPLDVLRQAVCRDEKGRPQALAGQILDLMAELPEGSDHA